MNNLEIDKLDGELNTPYSKKELNLHNKCLSIRSDLDRTYLHNLKLINLVSDWEQYVNGKAEQPQFEIVAALRPGNNFDNDACRRLTRIVKFYSAYQHGDCPFLLILVDVIRSTTTLIRRLSKLHYTKHLGNADFHIKEFFALITYRGEAEMTQDEFAAKLKEEIAAFCAAFTEHAQELGIYIDRKINGIKSQSEEIKDLRSDMKKVKAAAEEGKAAAEGSKAAAERTEAKIDKSAAISAADHAEIKKDSYRDATRRQRREDNSQTHRRAYKTPRTKADEVFH